MEQKRLSPNDGGCWFCYTDSGKLYFDWEFDTYVHIDCIKKAIEDGNPEAKLMSYLLNDNEN